MPFQIMIYFLYQLHDHALDSDDFIKSTLITKHKQCNPKHHRSGDIYHHKDINSKQDY